jgi:hypothetical protein
LVKIGVRSLLDILIVVVEYERFVLEDSRYETEKRDERDVWKMRGLKADLSEFPICFWIRDICELWI